MSLKDYVSDLQALVESIPFVTATSLSCEERPPFSGLIKDTIFFTDGSQLDIKEFLISHPTLHVIKYAYNYRKGDHLIFRYDNANDPAARDLPTFPSHKHLPSEILAAVKPSFKELLQEIISQLKFP
ncbi:MAG TPA: DUF6516 family protein [Nitrospiria bacterium]|nr:DUF6516 family protein [Nitrospiria bacterium]